MTAGPAAFVLRGHAEILAAARRHASSFVQHPTPHEAARTAAGRRPFRPPTHYGYAWDRCAMMDHDDMPGAVRRVVSRVLLGSGVPRGAMHYSIVSYRPGDHLLPHRDDTAHSLFSLTSSDEDGLVIQDEDGRFRRIPDRAGRHVVVMPGRWHWVDPVRRPRCTLIVSPRLPMAAY